jgi:beta-aspartyl-peptidase (threonine type)
MTFEPPWTPSMIEPSTSASLGFASEPGGIVLAVHGGAGTISRSTLTPDLEAQYRGSLERALRTGHAVLAKGGTSVDAVVATVKVFEDDPLFNAGKGAVFTHEGKNELDAAIMDGRTGQAGAVAGATRVKNPIVAARAVMENSRHVLLAGRGADQFASDQKLELVDPSYFFTQHRWDQLQKAKEKDRIVLDHDGTTASDEADAERPGAAAGDRSRALLRTDSKFGTVGAVALDQHGNLAAGTSTGGLTNKLYGRVGDSPIIGAGTYADNAAVAVSCSGTGEFFMRGAVAYDIAARMKYRGASVFDAVDEAIRESLDAKNGKGGLIALDGKGNVKFGFNTEGMYRGYVRADGEPVVQIHCE